MADLETAFGPTAEIIQALTDWLDDSSTPRVYSDGSSTVKGPYAALIIADFDRSPKKLLEHEPAEGALVLFADQRVCDGIYPPSVSLEPPNYQPEWLDRVDHLVFREVPPVTWVGLPRDDMPIRKQVEAALAAAGKVAPPGVPIIAVSLSGVDASMRKRLPLPSVPTHAAIAAWAAERATEEATRAKLIKTGQNPDGDTKWRPNGARRLSERIPACTICGRPEGRNHAVMCDRAWKLAGTDRRVNSGDCLSDSLRAQGAFAFNVGWPT